MVFHVALTRCRSDIGYEVIMSTATLEKKHLLGPAEGQEPIRFIAIMFVS